jgi:predicted SAM-dependent methyltransferase
MTVDVRDSTTSAPGPAAGAGTAVPAPQPRLLHLGCGLIAPPEWLNVDGSWGAWLAKHRRLRGALQAIRVLPKRVSEIAWPNNIQICDLRRRLPFADASFDACFSSHLIEHLHRDEALELLRDVRRVLKPGGLCRTVVPDLRAIVMEYIGQRKLESWYGEAEGTDDPAHRMLVRLHVRPVTATRGARQKLYTAFGDFQNHKWMYDGPSLVKLMTEAGFVDCRERGLHDTAIPHLEKVELPGRVEGGAGVAVEGQKPAL